MNEYVVRMDEPLRSVVEEVLSAYKDVQLQLHAISHFYTCSYS